MTESKKYTQLAEQLARLLFPIAEVSLFNEKGTQLAVFNEFSKKDIGRGLSADIEILTINNGQKKVKLAYFELTQGYYLRILIDLSQFEGIQGFISQFITAGEPKTETMIDNWHGQVEQFITDFLKDANKNFDALSANDKRDLVMALHSAGLFRYQEATAYIATKLNVSRATVYNYLNQSNEIKSLEIHQVDSFTSEPFSGNPAAVVLDADRINVQLMRKIAADLSLPETAYVLSSSKADFRLRFFTPSGDEIIFCGHSAVAALYMVAHKKLFNIAGPGQYHLDFETKLGIINASITIDRNNEVNIAFQPPWVNVVPTKINLTTLTEETKIDIKAINSDIPIRYEPINKTLFITAKSKKHLNKISIDIKKTKVFCKKNKIIAIIVLCNETESPNSDFYMRCFAPVIHVNEDPFTGAVLAGLVNYVQSTKQVPRSKAKFQIEQGHRMNRPGSVVVNIDSNDNETKITVYAKARHFASTQINL